MQYVVEATMGGVWMKVATFGDAGQADAMANRLGRGVRIRRSYKL